jgi:CRP/FNR family transcriptional regulator, cyclic AMP receptor protein
MKKLPMGPAERTALAGHLKKLSLFSALKEEELDRVVAVTHLYAYEKGRKMVFKKGHIGDALYIIHKGVVEIIKTRFPLPRRPVAVLKSGDAFGELAMVNQPYRTASAITDGYTELFVLLRPDFNEILQSNAALLGALHKRATRRRSVAT